MSTRIVTDGEGFYEVSHDRMILNAAFGRDSQFTEPWCVKELRVVVVRDVYPDLEGGDVFQNETRVRTPRANLARGSEWVRLGDARVAKMRDVPLVLNSGVTRGLLRAA